MTTNLSGSNIQDTFQQVIHTPDNTNFYNGTGSAVNLVVENTNTSLSQSLTFLASSSAEIIASSSLKIRGANIGGVGSDYLFLSDNNIDAFINGSEVFSIEDSQIVLNASGQNIDTKINYDSGLYSYYADANTERTKMYGFITIAVSGSEASGVPHADTEGSIHTALLISGNQYNIGQITASGDISSSGIITGKINGGSF